MDAEWRRRAAFHESGHAVIAARLGLPFSKVVVVSEGGMWLGPGADVSAETVSRWLTDRPAWPPSPLVRVPDIALMTCAGAAAERRYCRAAWTWTDGHWTDRIETESLLGRAMKRPPYGREVQALIAGLRRRADQLVRQEWPWIVAVAERLVAQGQVTAAGVRALRPGPPRGLQYGRAAVVATAVANPDFDAARVDG